ncbi:hypothetical protein [Embleya sp. NPDC059237]|uniref:hypothetical protein n=1 Tax=Embleya sp. NPDC059237 TaxID=3346784 RepID=UPI0036A31422
MRGIKDTSSAGRYHNRRFVELAREVGLTPPEHPRSVTGFEQCRLRPETDSSTWASVITALDAAAAVGLPATVRRERSGPAGATRFLVVCACPTPRRLQISPRQFDVAGLICAACTATFRPAATYADADPDHT